MSNINLKCQCGAVEGSVSHVSSKAGNHVVCYCDDCQTFANQLTNGDRILDEWGGTEIYQTAPWHISVHQGLEQLRCLRLTPKGLYRWYTGCCETPVANTLSASLPFVGLFYVFIDKDETTESKTGPVMGYHKLESASGDVAETIRKKGMPVRTTMTVFWRLLKWKLASRNKPNPFFSESGKAISRPEIVNKEPV